MGSPSARLMTREDLRPWVESGLEFIYVPGMGSAVASSGSQSAPKQDALPHQISSQSKSAAPQRPHIGRQQFSPPTPAPQPPPSAPAGPASTQPNFHGPWAGFLRLAKPNPKVVMTYMELGLDLGGQSDPRRRDVLRNLQAHLRWPPGTINFWPCSALQDNALQPNTTMFWQGWELWRTPTIACFGEEALRVLLPDADPSLSTHLLEHVIVYVLPPIAKLATLLPHEQQMAVDALCSIRL